MIQSVQQIKTDKQLLKLLENPCTFVWTNDERREIKINPHPWEGYASYQFIDIPRHGICPIENLWEFTKLIKSKSV
ncbi:hypothetical protein [Bacillus xiapuensis]|uniref:hypothetical protein n=1 Tax=Bacillus xiapuensis TaxID=2014075 RepID=UPI000C23D608|nr:hypothetical protein [Bacillus xiapuensis]